jgi:hypothetical protein
VFLVQLKRSAGFAACFIIEIGKFIIGIQRFIFNFQGWIYYRFLFFDYQYGFETSIYDVLLLSTTFYYQNTCVFIETLPLSHRPATGYTPREKRSLPLQSKAVFKTESS